MQIQILKYSNYKFLNKILSQNIEIFILIFEP